MPKRRHNSRTLAAWLWASITNSVLRDMVECSIHGMPAPCLSQTSHDKSATHVPAHVLPMSPVCTKARPQLSRHMCRCFGMVLLRECQLSHLTCGFFPTSLG